MISQEEILEKVLSRISEQVTENIRQTISEAVTRELSSAMAKALVESEFYRNLNEEMRLGLRGIYHEISSASDTQPAGAAVGDDPQKTQKLFSDATQQIEEIMQTTLEATNSILESTEKLLQQQEEAGVIIAALSAESKNEDALAKLDQLNSSLEASLTDIITSLSFQDLTGQRLKKVVTAITSIRETVFDLYVSTGLMMKSREEEPEKDIQDIAEESRRKVEEIKNSELKGPTLGSKQSDVDDLLASLGM
jgi:chemotaxis protein CheZ